MSSVTYSLSTLNLTGLARRSYFRNINVTSNLSTKKLTISGMLENDSGSTGGSYEVYVYVKNASGNWMEVGSLLAVQSGSLGPLNSREFSYTEMFGYSGSGRLTEITLRIAGGSYSNDSTSKLNINPTSPGIITSPAMGQIISGGETISVVWGASTDQESDPITYEVSASYDSGSTYQVVVNTSATSTSYQAPKDVTKTKVRFKVIAKDFVGQSSPRISQDYQINQNSSPALILTSPTANQTLTEGGQLPVEGSANDQDIGDSVTVKYKINNGTARNLDSKVPNGSPFSFSKNLIYKNKRLYDGAIDIVGVDLAENVDHILTVWSEDDKQGKSAEEIRKFRVIWNRPPVIDGQNGDIGIHEAPPTVTYAAYDPEGNPFTVIEKINGVATRSFAGVANRQETFEIKHDTWLRLEPGVLHTLTIEATDDQGMSSKRMYTLTRFVDKITFNGMEYALLRPETREFFTTDVAAKRLLLTPMWDLPPGVNLLVEACNNGYDAVPTWEDATHVVKTGRIHMFNNTTKTAAKWGINFRFRIEKGSAIFPIYFKGVGGAFD
ncbi:Ig-like domain-containing protein [Brevibacillus reuszeri]|uniref:Ig-like domain-containing protein n=1 Tax=Brevibacillus reuszeri TaxID=54915 RepID=UPI0028994A26|nr:Ig-like domain-containing protein [Brevibacillus reuszeri]